MGVIASSAVGAKTNRALAWQSLLFAAGAAAATLISPLMLQSAAPLGQAIVFGLGAMLALSAFAFGAMLAVQNRYARKAGFVVVALAYTGSALCGLLSIVVEDSRLIFLLWSAVALAYAAAGTHRLVRWPAAGAADRPKSTLRIFFSYRRDDANDTVARIYEYLKQDFAEDRMFLDVERQIGGDDFREAIRSALAQADVVLAVIGPKWVVVTDEQGRRRLDDSTDLVRREVEFALGSRARVIPVLVQGAKVPKPEDLPETLGPLCYRNAVAIRPDPDFRRDVDQLVGALRQPELDVPSVDRR